MMTLTRSSAQPMRARRSRYDTIPGRPARNGDIGRYREKSGQMRAGYLPLLMIHLVMEER